VADELEKIARMQWLKSLRDLRRRRYSIASSPAAVYSFCFPNGAALENAFNGNSSLQKFRYRSPALFASTGCVQASAKITI
jgi:hypothetical protein